MIVYVRAGLRLVVFPWEIRDVNDGCVDEQEDIEQRDNGEYAQPAIASAFPEDAVPDPEPTDDKRYQDGKDNEFNCAKAVWGVLHRLSPSHLWRG